MPTPSIVATILTAALTFTTGGAGTDTAGSGAMTNAAPSTSASTDSDQGDQPGTTKVDVVMEDHRFTPNSIDVRVGDTVTFTFFNFGKAIHDAFIGDKAAQDQHEKEMRESSSAHGHAETGGVTVPPGQSGMLRYTFDKAGTLEIGCHQPGHYTQFRMIAILNVRPA